jgi:hypothetical protein
MVEAMASYFEDCFMIDALPAREVSSPVLVDVDPANPTDAHIGSIAPVWSAIV